MNAPFETTQFHSDGSLPMKRMVFLALLLCFLITTYISYWQTLNQEINYIAMIEREFAQPFFMPEHKALKNPDDVSEILEKAALDTKVNLFRGAQYYRPDEQIEYIKYIMITSPKTKFYHLLQPIQGEKILSNEASNLYISSTKTNNNNQIGHIRIFNPNMQLTIKSLQTSFDYLPVYGRYFVETKDDKQLDYFLNSLLNGLNTYVQKQTKTDKITFEISDLQPSEAFIKPIEEFFPKKDLSNLNTNKQFMFILTAFLMMYYILKISKKIGVMKLHGISNFKIWWIFIGKLLTTMLLTLTLVSLVFSAFLSHPVFFIKNSITQLALAYLILSVLSSICYTYVAGRQLDKMIKNKKQTKVVFFLNILSKIIIATFIILLSLDVISQYTKLQDEQYMFKHLDEWNNIDDYGVIEAYTGYTTAYSPEEMEKDLSRSDQAFAELYNILNRQGALYVDATEYEEEFLWQNRGYAGIFSMIVNLNFLTYSPIYNADGEQIQIDETDKNWIILIPEQYKHEEKEILDYFNDSRDFYLALDQGQELKIIWIQKDQRVFSMNPEVSSQNNNLIIDPVIHIKTEKNHLFTYRGGILGKGLGDPLKVKLKNNDAVATYKTIESELERLKLESSIDIRTNQEFINKRLESLDQDIKSILLVILGMLGIYIFLTIQNLLIYFDKYAKQFIIKRLFGVHFINTYKSAFLLLLIIFFLSVCISVFIDISQLYSFTSLIVPYLREFLIIVMILLMMEVVITAIAIIIIEKRNSLQVIQSE